MKKSSRTSFGKNEDKPVRFVGRYYFENNTAAVLGTVGLNPLLMDSRLLSVSDNWLEYKFVKLRARVWTYNPTVQYATLGVAFTPNLLTNVPATLAQLSTLQDVAFGNGTYGSAYPSISVSASGLVGSTPVKWFRRGTTVDDTLEQQGTLYYMSVANFNTTTIHGLVEYEVLFRAPADSFLTAPALSQDPGDLAAEVAELQRVLGLQGRLQHRAPNPAQSEQKTEDPPDDWESVVAEGRQNKANRPVTDRPGAVSSAKPKVSALRRPP